MWFKRRKTIFETLSEAYGGPFVCRVVEAKGRYDPGSFSLRFQRAGLEYFVAHGRAGYTVLVGAAAGPDRMKVTRQHHDGLVEFDVVRRNLGVPCPRGQSLEDILAQFVALEPLLKVHFAEIEAAAPAPPPPVKDAAAADLQAAS